MLLLLVRETPPPQVLQIQGLDDTQMQMDSSVLLALFYTPFFVPLVITIGSYRMEFPRRGLWVHHARKDQLGVHLAD